MQKGQSVRITGIVSAVYHVMEHVRAPLTTFVDVDFPGGLQINQVPLDVIALSMRSNPFIFNLGANVCIHGNEKGEVIGRAEYKTCPPRYQVRYISALGSTEQWWDEDALTAAKE